MSSLSDGGLRPRVVVVVAREWQLTQLDLSPFYNLASTSGLYAEKYCCRPAGSGFSGFPSCGNRPQCASALFSESRGFPNMKLEEASME